jgi:hypothetical protein
LLEISISSNSRNLLQLSVKEKEGNPDRKPYPLSYGLRNPYRNLKSENSQDYAQKPQRDFTFMNSASVTNHDNAPQWHIHNNMPVKGHFKEFAKQLYQYLLYSQIAKQSFTSSAIFSALH